MSEGARERGCVGARGGELVAEVKVEADGARGRDGE